MSEKDYPEWGMFGEEEKLSKPKLQEPESAEVTLLPVPVKYATETTLDGTTRHVANLNTPQDHRVAALAAAVEAAMARLRSPQAGIYKLKRTRRKPIIPAIEIARAMAVDPNEAIDVWEALCDLANAPNRPSVLLGLNPDRTAVRFRANSNDTDNQSAGLFTVKDVREALKHSVKETS